MTSNAIHVLLQQRLFTAALQGWRRLQCPNYEAAEEPSPAKGRSGVIVAELLIFLAPFLPGAAAIAAR